MRNVILLCLFFCFTQACKQANSAATDKAISASTMVKEERKVGFVHAVYFYLNDDATEEDKKKFESALIELAKVESIVDLHWGPPAGTPRKVVDNTYDYAFIPMFEDKAGHDAYQIDPIHKKFVDQFEYLFKDVKVYDNICN